MWLTALVIGLAGSLHCMTMCSPLAIAVFSLRKPFLVNRLTYNAGRIFSYGILGALVSSFGSLFQFSGYQNVLTIGLGSLLIILGMAGSNQIRIPLLTSALQKMTTGLKNLFSKFLNRKTTLSISVLGMLNGLLPCGLTYLALTYCLILPGASAGFIFMLFFGVGTLPAMLGITSLIPWLMNRFRFSLRKLTNVVMIAMGALLITRSLYVYHDGHSSPVASTGVTICK